MNPTGVPFGEIFWGGACRAPPKDLDASRGEILWGGACRAPPKDHGTGCLGPVLHYALVTGPGSPPSEPGVLGGRSPSAPGGFWEGQGTCIPLTGLGLGTLVLAPDSPRHDGGGRGPKMSPTSARCAGSRLLGPAFGSPSPPGPSRGLGFFPRSGCRSLSRPEEPCVLSRSPSGLPCMRLSCLLSRVWSSKENVGAKSTIVEPVPYSSSWRLELLCMQ